MERLTRRSKVGEGLPVRHLNIMHEDTTSEDTLTEILDLLADYEDTGLSPDQLREIDKLYAEKCKELAEYKKAVEDGLLLRLPCKVGDAVYIITTCKSFPPKLDGTMWDADGGFGTATGYYCPYEENCPHDEDDCSGVESKLNIFEDVVVHVCIEEDKIWFVCENSNGWELKDFGKTIFLTQEEAETALAEWRVRYE